MRGIKADGKCKECGGKFKWDNDRGYCCENESCRMPARAFTIYWKWKGKLYERGTDFSGEKLRTHYDAQKLYDQAQDEIKKKIFEPRKWLSKEGIQFYFETLFDKFYKEKERAMKAGNLATSYVPKLKSYRTHYEKFFIKADVREVHNLKDFYYQLPETLSPKYKKNLIDTLKSFFIWLRDEERLIQQIPRIPNIKIDEYEPVTVSKEIQLKVLEAIPAEDRPIFEFMVHQGCRPSEARALMWECISFEHESVCYKRNFQGRRELKEHTKTHQIRYNYLWPETHAMLKKLPTGLPKSFIFTNPRTGKPYVPDTLNLLFRKACEATGYEWLLKTAEPLYEFGKHSWGTQKYNEGIPLEMIQAHFGHTKADMTKKYAKLKVVNAFKTMQAERLKKVENDSK